MFLLNTTCKHSQCKVEKVAALKFAKEQLDVQQHYWKNLWTGENKMELFVMNAERNVVRKKAQHTNMKSSYQLLNMVEGIMIWG